MVYYNNYLPSLAIFLIPWRVWNLEMHRLDVQLHGAALRETSAAVMALIPFLARMYLHKAGKSRTVSRPRETTGKIYQK